MTILDKIIAEKKQEVEELKAKDIMNVQRKNVDSFYNSVKNNHKMSIIAEIKRASPSKGMIHPNVDPVKQALIYEEAGAKAISVLTDTPFFQGTMDDLRKVRAAVNLPILCKDFMIDKIQIDHAYAAGANIILLIAAALDDTTFKELYQYAEEKGLEILCEVHNEEEMERVLKLNPKLVGVNNRDLKTFHVDLKTTERLANMVHDEDCLFISESGLKTIHNIEEVASYGAEAILVGETFMRAQNVQEAVQAFQVALK